MMHLVMNMNDATGKSYRAITVRIPKDEYERLKGYSTAHRVSLNSVVSDAIAEHAMRIERQQLLDDIAEFHRRLQPSSGDSVDYLRKLREGRALQLVSDRPSVSRGAGRKHKEDGER